MKRCVNGTWPPGGATPPVVQDVGRLLHDRFEHDVAVAHAGMVALKIDRPRAVRIGPEGTAGGARNELVVDDPFAVEDDGGVPVDEGDVERLPLAGWFFGGFGRLDAAVDAAHVVGVGGAAVRVGDLD